jgi:NAD-dependent DNA ligase
MSFVFTGVRRTDLEQIIESRGGKIGSAKNTSHLVMKSKDQDQVKENKAIALGVKNIT